MQNPKTLVISLPRGLYRLTKCKICKHTFKCENCDNNLTTFKVGIKNILVCSECQSQYDYPKTCPKCNSPEIESQFGGRDYLEDQLEKNDLNVEVSNRIYDPLLDYNDYDRIIITHAENLFLGIDYQSIEEAAKSLTELLVNVQDQTKIVFDQKSGGSILDGIESPIKWFNDIITREKLNREKFAFPPAVNLILISSSDKSHSQAEAKLNVVRKELIELQIKLPELGKPSYPYEAKMLRRRGFYTMHMFIKYPKNYSNVTTLNQCIAELKNRYRLTVRLNPRHIF
jgi:primosomal protein N' (replication factor Y) (superfamily II helicase)